MILNEPVRQNVYMDDATPYGLRNPVCCADGIVYLADLCRGEVEMIYRIVAVIIVSAVIVGIIWIIGFKNEKE